MVLLVSSFFVVGFYYLYLNNVAISNRFFRNIQSGNQQIKVVEVKIPRGSAENVHINFVPAEIIIQIGVNNTVRWVNEDDDWHTAHSNLPEFYSDLIQPGANFTHTFETPGIYPYHCDPHPWMTGIIIVK